MYKRVLAGFKIALDVLERVLMILCVILLALVVTIHAIEIFTRYFMNYSSTVSGELGLILASWMYFLGFIILFKRGEDVVMEYFFRFLPDRIGEIVDWLSHVAIFIFLAVLVWKSIKFYIMTRMMEHPFLPIKYSYTVQPILVGSILALVVAIYFVWEKADLLVKRWNLADRQQKSLD